MKFPSPALMFTCLFVFVPFASGEEWREFRGYTTGGRLPANSALPTSWSPEQGVKWRTEIPGEGWSSPVVADGKIYLTTAIQNEQKGYDLCLITVDSTSGAVLGQRKVFEQPADAPNIHKKNSHASPTPLLSGTSLYLHFGHQGTACVDRNSGEILWKNDSLEYPPVHGNGGSPVLVGDLLIFSRDGGSAAVVTALDAKTGQVRWEVARDVEVDRTFSFCTPFVFSDEAGRQQLIIPGSNVVQSLDPASGKEHWRLQYEGYSVIPKPIIQDGLVFVCTGYNRPSVLAIDPSGSGDVTDSHLRWQSKSNVPHTPSLVGHAGKIFMVSDRGIASCVSAASGEEVWKKRIGGNFSASPMLVGNNLYLLDESGVCTILDVSASTPSEIAVNKLEERSLASFAIVDSDLLLRTDAALYRITE